MYTETPCKKVYAMATSHSPFFSQPQELTDILCEIALDKEPVIHTEQVFN
ncbi:MAG: hypothetical protein JNK14_15860 [Chitinophagaceae bacterium]|nr:hypothetical protein [Chitinophagaceae bacterium]